MKRFLASLCCLTLTVGLWVGTVPSANAVPLPASYGGSSGGDVANVGVNVIGGLQLAGVRLANADSQVDSTATERSSATSRNLGATVAGLGVSVDQKRQVAPPDNPTDPGSQALAQVNALGIGATGLSSSDRARWTGDTTCFSGDLANSYVSTDSVNIAPLGLASILTTGTASTRATTGLVTTSGLNKAVRSQTSASVANVNLLGTAVQVAITGASTLGVTADGSTTTAVADYRPGTISYTAGGTTRPLALGDDVSFDVGTVTTGRNTIALKANRPTTTGTGRSARSSVAGVVSVTVTTRAPITQTVTGVVSVDLLPLTVAAQAPAGGIDCTPDAPTVTTPANGSRTNDATPTYSGTGRPGASINLTLDGGAALTGVATVDGSQAWSYTPTVDLADGTHRVSVTQTVNGATSPASSTNTFTLDATAPAAPRVTTPPDDALLATARPTYAGTAEAGSTVNVFVDGSSVGTATADSAGAFSLPAPSPLADGTHTVYATATDATGNTSLSSATNTFRVDATAPAAPVVVAPAASSTIRDTTPRIAGTAEAGSSVVVYVDGTRLTTAVTASGTSAWETTSGTLGEGLHVVRAQASDAAGNVSPFSDAVTFRIDRTAPSAPVVVDPADGSRTSDPTPTISGTGEVDATVTVEVDGALAGTPTVDGAGRWTLTPTTVLPDGSHVVTARQGDAAGNISASTSNTFTVDTTAPAVPVITGPAPGSVLRGPAVTISGTGEPGATLTVTDDLGGSLTPVTVGASGTWTAQDTGLADGTHTVTAVQADAVGNVSGRSNPVSFRVAANASAAPVISVPADGSVTNAATVTISGRGVAGDQVVLTDGTARAYPTTQVTPAGTWSVAVVLPEGTYTVSATQDDGAGASASSTSVTFTVDRTSPAAPAISTPADRSLVRDTTPRLGGTGEPGASVAVTVDTRSVGTARVGGDGTWTLPLTTALGQGSHTVVAVQTDAAGNSSVGSTSTFTVDTVAPAAPAITSPTEGSALRVATPTVRGTGTAGDTIELAVDGGPTQTTTVATDGTWSITPTALSEGGHTATAVAVDPAGNRSSGADVGFTVDLTAPAAPVVQRPADGSSTRDATPTLSGLAEARGTVLVSLNGSLAGTTVATSAGTWSLVTPSTLPEGTYSVSAVVRDAAGNVSTTSATTTFTVDRTAPSAPTITAPANGALITDRTPTVSGTGETGDRVTVTLDGQALGSVTVNAGTWSVPVTDPLGQGQHVARATQTDAAGNDSAAASSTFRVDSVAPDAPVVTAPSQNAVVTGPDVTVTGTGEAGARLVLTVDTVDQDPVTVGSGGAWSVRLTGLADGSKTVSAVQTDTAGNVSVRSADRVFTVGGTAPAAPVVTTPGADALVSDTTPTIGGTGIDGAVVTARVDGDVVGTGTVAGGSWSVTPTNAIGEGSHVATATQTVGVVASAESSPVRFTVDSAAPARPSITAPADGTVTGDTAPAISGTGEPDAVVTVFDNGTPLATATVGQGGSWALPTGTTLTPGLHALTAWQTDPAGNTSGTSSPVSVTVDTSAPAAPVITSPADGSVVRDTTPRLGGTGEPGASVAVTVDARSVGSVRVVGDGTWSLPLTTALGQGDHTVVAVQTDAAGNASGRATSTFTVDTTPPAAPVITAPRDGSVLRTTTPSVRGTGTAGDTVALSFDGGPAQSTTVASDGTWSITPAAISEGDHTASAVAIDPAGNRSTAAEVGFTVDVTVPGAPVVQRPADGTSTRDTTPTLAGLAEARGTVLVSLNGSLVGVTTATAEGTWSLVTPSALTEGAYTVSAVVRDAAGNVSTRSVTTTFTVDLTPPSAPTISSPADGALTTDRTPTVAGTGETGARVTVTLDGQPLGSATVNAGSWSVPITDRLDQGEHVVRATQADPAGNVSTTVSSTFRVDSVAPDSPVITAPADGTVTGDSTPAISGTGEPGALVTVLDGGNPLGTGTVGQGGSWALPTGTTLTPGLHELTARQTDPAGNTSETSSSTRVTVDTAAPSVPVISTPTQGATLPGPAVTVNGTGEAGARLTLRLDGTDQPSVVVGSDSTWTVALTAVADGDHVVTAVQTDRAGNASARTADRGFTVAAGTPVPPDAPSIDSPVQGSTVTGPDVSVTGAGVAGASLVLTLDGVPAPAVTVGQGGQWSVRVTGLTDGPHTATAVQSVDGRTSARTVTRDFTTESTPATPAPAVTVPAAGSSTADRTPVISGTGLVGATVTVLVDGTLVGTADVGSAGTWSLTPGDRLGLGAHTVVATQRPTGGTASPQSAGVTFTVVATPPPAPVITSPTAGATSVDLTPTISGTGAPGATVTVSVDATPVGPTATVDTDTTWSVTLPEQSEGTHDITATQTDAEGTTSAPSAAVRLFVRDVTLPVITTPRSGAVFTVPRPTVSGTGEAGASVTVTVLAGPATGDALGTTTVASGGTWSLVVDQDLARGTYRVAATQRVSATPDRTSNEVSFLLVDTPNAPTALAVRPGDRQLGLTFTAPPAAGGKPTTGYQVSLDGGRTWAALSTKAGTPASATVAPVLNGSTYAVQVRAVNANGAGRSTATLSVKVPAWFSDPVSTSDRAKEVAVPKNPSAYKGKLARTTATNRSRNGTLAYPVANLKGRQLQPQQAVELSSALFGFDSAKLTTNGKKAIASMLPSLRYVTAVTCEGFADYGGSSKNEDALAKARAAAVCAELKKSAKQVTSLTTAGYGSSYPVIIGGKPADRAANRRTVILIRS